MEDDSARVHRKKKDASMIRMLDDLNNQIIKASAIANNVSFLNSYDKKY